MQLVPESPRPPPESAPGATNGDDGAPGLSALLARHAGPLAGALVDPSCRLFRTDGVDGVVGYRRALGCVAAIGDPLCSAGDAPVLAAALARACRSEARPLAWASVSSEMARIGVEAGWAAVAFGEELILDPRRDAQAGPRGRELRKKVRRARREGVTTREYAPLLAGRRLDLEHDMDGAVARWLRARRGPQAYLCPVRLFERPFGGVRWFAARCRDRVVGVLLLVETPRTGGVAVEHLLAAPDAPPGTSEALLCDALAQLGASGCARASFGPTPASRLGAIHHLDPLSTVLARGAYRSIARLVGFEARARFRHKFQPASSEPAWVLFDPPRVGLRQVAALLGTFHVALPILPLPATPS